MSYARSPSRPPRPSKYPYNFKYIKNFPRRVLFPPPTVGHVRSFKITPIYDVSLDDVLDGKHLPPLTLKDFEDYLVFEAHSAENLYFICWLRDYTAKYNRWAAANQSPAEEKRPQASPELMISFARARGTFFDPSSHLELNLPSDLMENLIADTQHFSNPNPASLIPIQKHVEGMLRDSLMKFVGSSCRNSGRLRGLFAIIVGTAAILVGLIPVLLSILGGESRWIRLTALPAFWFGALTAIAGFHGVCIVIFLFGDARQLYPYELARPSLQAVPPIAPLTLPLPVTMGGGNPGGLESISAAGSDEDGGPFRGKTPIPSPYNDDKIFPMSPLTSSNSSTTAGRTIQLPASLQGTLGGATAPASSKGHSNNSHISLDYIPETAGFIPSYTPSISTSYAAPTGQPLRFDFDSLPPPSSRKSQDSEESGLTERGMFASLTKVFSPIVARGQWEIIMRSAMLGVLVALLLGGVCFAVPFKH